MIILMLCGNSTGIIEFSILFTVGFLDIEKKSTDRVFDGPVVGPVHVSVDSQPFLVLHFSIFVVVIFNRLGHTLI